MPAYTAGQSWPSLTYIDNPSSNTNQYMIKEESTVEDQREQDTTPYFSLQVDNGKTNMKENVLTLFMSTNENEVANNGVLD